MAPGQSPHSWAKKWRLSGSHRPDIGLACLWARCALSRPSPIVVNRDEALPGSVNGHVGFALSSQAQLQRLTCRPPVDLAAGRMAGEPLPDMISACQNCVRESAELRRSRRTT